MFLRCTFVIETMKITALQYFYLAFNNYDIISERYLDYAYSFHRIEQRVVVMVNVEQL